MPKRVKYKGLARFVQAPRGRDAVSNAAAYHIRYIAARGRTAFPKLSLYTRTWSDCISEASGANLPSVVVRTWCVPRFSMDSH